jgi:exonuclease SbcC
MSSEEYSSRMKTTYNTQRFSRIFTKFSEFKKDEMKLTITEYASTARNELNKNARIKEHISRLRYIGELFKKLLTDIIEKKSKKSDILKLLIKFNNIFKQDNKVLKSDIKEEIQKVQKYENYLIKNMGPLKDELEQAKSVNFILQNNLIYCDNTIQNLTLIQKGSLIKENKVETIIKKDVNILFDDFLTIISKVYQDVLLSSMKDLNKLKNKNALQNKKINFFKNIINNQEINSNFGNCNFKDNDENKIKEGDLENTILSFKEFDLLPTIESLETIEKKIEENGIKVDGEIYNLPQKNLIKSNININLNMNCEIPINKNSNNHKRILSQNLDNFNIKKQIELPKLNLEQINFNKNNKSYNLSSNLKRNKTPENSNNREDENKSDITDRKKLLKQIKNIKKEIKNNKKTIKDFKKFYALLMNKYEKYIFGPEIEYYVLTKEQKSFESEV